MDLSELAEGMRSVLDDKTAARERGLTRSRDAIRACGNAIRALHRYEHDVAGKLLEEARDALDDARAALQEHPDIMHAGFVHDAEKEYAEANLTLAFVTDGPLPTPEQLDVSVQAFLKGMAEAIGELRRHILDLMRHHELKRGEQLLDAMDDMYYVLTSMDYPDGITFGLRRLTDVARSIIERTRGDYTTSVIQSSLHDALNEHSRRLREGE